MRAANPRPTPGTVQNALIGLGLLIASGVVGFFTSCLILQAFSGPRTVSEQELLRLTDLGPGTHYVSFTPTRPAVDTGLQYGKKDNPGTKFLLLPIGDKLMLCSARIANDGPTFEGRLERINGGTEEEVLQRIGNTSPEARQRTSPVMLQAVRSIWFDTSVALAAIVGLALGGLWCLLQPLFRKDRRPPSPDADPSRVDPDNVADPADIRRKIRGRPR